VDSSLPLDYRANPTRLGLWLVGLGLFLGTHLGRVMSIRNTVDVVFMPFNYFILIQPPDFINVYKAHESMPMNRFRQPIYPSWESIPGLLKRFRNSGSEPVFVNV
jgi:hypothetical protein